MAVTEIMDVIQTEPPSDRLWGGYIDIPKPGSRLDGYAIDLIGWVLGRVSPVVAVEVVHEGSVVRRVPITVSRPDVAAAFPQVPSAERSGFRASVSVLGMTARDLQVQAVLQDQSRVPLGVIRARRGWQEEDYCVGASLVSVIIPCHDQAPFLSEAIESVLAQSYPHFEIVVVDAGSSDHTPEVAARYPSVRCVRQEDCGLATACNTGLRRSNGSYLVFLDAADRLLPQALEIGLTCMNAYPECAFVAGHYRHIASDGTPQLTSEPPHIEKDHYLAFLRDCHIAMSGVVMYRRAVFEAVIGFDPTLRVGVQHDVILRIARDFPVYCHDAVVGEFRQSSYRETVNSETDLNARVTVLRAEWKYLRRRGRPFRRAYRNGLRLARRSYGVPQVNRVRAHLHEHQWQQAWRGLLALLRHYPQGCTLVLSSCVVQLLRLNHLEKPYSRDRVGE
ncbi:MAG: glycosyltransferase [Candidatus Entotheonellia bacterium]